MDSVVMITRAAFPWAPCASCTELTLSVLSPASFTVHLTTFLSTYWAPLLMSGAVMEKTGAHRPNRLPGVSLGPTR